MLLLPAFATARSSLPSRLKSPTATERGPDPARMPVVLSATEGVGVGIFEEDYIRGTAARARI